MIEMKRVRLINWHNFVNDLVDFDQITYMVGVNAVGKTTILDAIRYCLTTSKDFNALGNRKSGRTLQGSVHGKQREENTYTRPGHTVSYVGVEFLDRLTNSQFVITVRIESENPEQELRQVKQTWYISPKNVTLEDLPFLDSTTNQPSAREQFCLKGAKMLPIDRQKEAQGKICQRLGIGLPESQLAKQFGEVFPMGTSVEEISDFKTFIYNYVLPQPDIDLDEMQQDEVELENLEEVLLNAQNRTAQLEEIVNAGAEARKRERDMLLNRGFVLCAERHEKAGVEEQVLAELERSNIRREQLEQEYQAAKQAEEDALAAYEQAVREASESDAQKKLDGLKAYQKELKQSLNEALHRLERFQHVCESIQMLKKEAEKYGFSLSDDLMPASIEKMPEREQARLESELINRLHSIEKELDQQRKTWITECENKKAKLKELNKRIQALSSGNWVYPDNNSAQRVKDEINRSLAGQGMEPDAKIVCELLYLVDEAWQSSVEACLGGRRFDVFVEPEHYKAAKRAYEKMGRDVQKISLLDSRALKRSLPALAQPDENTLAAKVKSENPLVAAYVTDLLGKIVCCETSDELEEHPHSVTKDLLRHYPYRLARLREPEKYIGQDARRKQLETAKQEAETLLADVTKREQQEEELHRLCARFQKALNENELKALSGGWNSRQQYETQCANYAAMEEQVHACESDPMLLASMRREQILKADYEEKKERTKKVYSDTVQEEAKAKRFQEMQEKAIRDADAAREAWQGFVEEHGALREDAEKKYQEAVRRIGSARQVVQNQSRYQEQVNRALSDFVEDTLKPLQREYNQKYTCDFALGLNAVELYQSQYEQLVRIELEKYRSNLQKAKERCKERFRRDTLFRLKNGIADARKQFRKINRVMEKLTYGEETYRFSIGPSEDPQLAAFCRLIEHGSNQPVPEEGTLEALAYEPDQAYEAQLDDLMEHIMTDLRIAAEERQKGKKVSSIELSSYVDYRQYLSCDIEITNAVTQKTTRLSSVSADSSGGENQAPFYIAICASLLQIYQQCENSVRLILLDEAFSKMTSDRIHPMMKMFRDMELQVVMITTVEKASAIAPFCDLTHSIVKKGSRNAVCPFYLEGDEPR